MITRTNANPIFLATSLPTKSPTLCIKPLPKTPELPPLVNATALLADGEQVPPDEIVAGLIHAGTKVILGGSSKVGKPWLLLHLALCVASGKKFMKWATNRGRALYINLEIQNHFMTGRIRALAEHFNIDGLSTVDVILRNLPPQDSFVAEWV